VPMRTRLGLDNRVTVAGVVTAVALALIASALLGRRRRRTPRFA